eukprot:2815660-Pleurochrysis_carterae.AAC.1
MPKALWQVLNKLAPGILASRDWTSSFAKFACQLRPKPSAIALPGVGAVMFDNYSRKVLFSSHKTSEGGGFTLDMPNSCTMLHSI